jgi:hypothetical protein
MAIGTVIERCACFDASTLRGAESESESAPQGISTDPWPTRTAFLNESPLPRDQLTVPAKQCLGRNDRAKLVQRFAPERPRLLGQLSTLGVGEDDAPSTKPCAEHAVLRFQIVDSCRLLPLRPTGDYHQQELQKRRRGSHRDECWLLIFTTSTVTANRVDPCKVRMSFGTARDLDVVRATLGLHRHRVAASGEATTARGVMSEAVGYVAWPRAS